MTATGKENPMRRSRMAHIRRIIIALGMAALAAGISVTAALADSTGGPW